MKYVECGPQVLRYLGEKDPELGRVIARMGPIEREMYGDPFSSLLRSVVGQLISRKAAETVWQRLTDRVGEMTPQRLAAVPLEELRACGLSRRKAECLHAIAHAAESRAVDFSAMDELGDQEIIRLLSDLPGVGVWTAEMLLLFALGRPDVVSYGDLGIRGGMMLLYGLEKLSKKEFQAYRSRYTPYGSTASLYLWALWGERQGEKNAAGI